MHLWYLQMKGIQFLLCLIALHTVVGEFIESSSWMTWQDKSYASRYIVRCEIQGGDRAQCVGDLMTNTDTDNQNWSCEYPSRDKILIQGRNEKYFVFKAPTGEYSCTWTDPFCYFSDGTDPRCQ